MIKYTYYYIILVICIFLAFFFLVPDLSDLIEITEIFFVLPGLLLLFYRPLTKRCDDRHHGLNLGKIYFFVMFAIIIIGNMRNFIMRMIYPAFGEYITITNFYWIGGMALFAIGFLHSARSLNLTNGPFIQDTKYELPLSLIYFLFSLGLLASLYSFYILGHIPFFSGVGTGERYTAKVAETSLIIRLFSCNLLAAVLGFIYYIRIKKDPFAIILVAISSLASLFFITRTYPMLIGTTIIFVIMSAIRNTKQVMFILIFALIAFAILNFCFIDYRSGSFRDNRVLDSPHINYAQKIIYQTFNEYNQLDMTLHVYNEPPQYGKTLIAIPIGLIPAPLLEVFGISKEKILQNNSAVLLAKYLMAVESRGLRIGILGEFYINFKYYGFLFMYFVGLIVGYLQNKLAIHDMSDYRYGFYLIFYTITIYALVGQSDAIGSILSNILIIFLILHITPVHKKF